MLAILAITPFALRAATPTGDDETPITAAERTQGFRNGRLLIRLKADADLTKRETLEGKAGITRRRTYQHLDRQQVLEFESTRSVPALVKELRASGLYEIVEPDHVLHALATPNDISFSTQWSLNNTGQSGGLSGADIRAVSAWDTLSSAQTVVVGVLDSGLRLTHEDLKDNLWVNPTPNTSGYKDDLHGINATVTQTNAASGNPTDDAGHGSHVSGIIGATGNNGVGISGVAQKVQLMGLKFLDATGSGSSSAELACFNYAIANKVKVINGSFGSTSYSASEFAAIQQLKTAGIILVAAAGNDGLAVETGSYPAGYLLDNIVTVAATTRTDALATYSDYSSGLVDIAAPGSEIYSTYNTSDSGYTILSGTSMAAPHVTGALALLIAKFPGENYRLTINRLLRSTTHLAVLDGKVQTAGRLNLQTAITSTVTRPFNDDFSTRALLSGANVRVRSSNVGATAEAGEPAHASNTASHSLWWSWTAPASTTVVFDTTGSDYDTVLGVYTNSVLSALVPAGSSDNASSSVTTSRVTFAATAGTTYQIAVDGKSGATGLTVLRVGVVPPNDNFASATTVTGTSFKIAGSTLNASAETGEPNHASVSQHHSVWYKWTAPSSGRFQLAAFSAQSDAVEAVYTGSAVGALTTIASNDDSISYNTDSLLSFIATAGQLYYFAVDSADPDGGDFTLTLVDSVWQYPSGDEVTSSPAVGSDGTIYFGSQDGYLYAVNADGTLKWDRSLGTSITLSSPAIGTDGNVYVGTDDSVLYAVSAATGARKWTYTATTAVVASPAIGSDGTVYYRDDTHLVALTSNATSATLKWSFALTGGTYSSPSIASDSTIYVGGISGAFYAVNPTGTLKWRVTLDNDVYTTPAIATDGTIYVATLSGSMYALTADGAVRWTSRTTGGNSITSSPALGVDGTLYFGAYDHKLHAVGSNGVEKWTYTAGDEMRASSPAVGADGTIYFGDYDSLLYAVNSSGVFLRTYATAGIIRSSPVIANNRLYFGSSDSKLYALAIGQNAASSSWPMYHQNALRQGRVTSTGAVTITTPPASQSVSPGGSLTLSVAAIGTGTLSYQWFKDGVAIAGANGATYTITNATAANSGTYTVVVTNSLGSTTSSGATVSIVASRLSNLSARAVAGPNDQTLIVGFVVTGGSKQVLVRGIGPGLTATFGLGGTLADPQLSLYDGSSVVQSNDNWGGSATLVSSFATLGGFPLDPASKDAAILTTLGAKGYTAQVTGSGGGVVLAEIYDADASTSPSRLSNLSARAQVGTDANVLIAGFVIAGTSPKQVLIRGIGPGLNTTFGLSGVLAAPQLTLFNSSGTQVSTNAIWGGSSTLASAMLSVGAFALDAASKDSVLLVTLPPGAYTAQVSGVNNTTGVALIEVYEMP